MIIVTVVKTSCLSDAYEFLLDPECPGIVLQAEGIPYIERHKEVEIL